MTITEPHSPFPTFRHHIFYLAKFSKETDFELWPDKELEQILAKYFSVMVTDWYPSSRPYWHIDKISDMFHHMDENINMRNWNKQELYEIYDLGCLAVWFSFSQHSLFFTDGVERSIKKGLEFLDFFKANEKAKIWYAQLHRSIRNLSPIEPDPNDPHSNELYNASCYLIDTVLLPRACPREDYYRELKAFKQESNMDSQQWIWYEYQLLVYLLKYRGPIFLTQEYGDKYGDTLTQNLQRELKFIVDQYDELLAFKGAKIEDIQTIAQLSVGS